jgi:uncharacterized BrkB/YihY/UPF0761 family membrane protein
MQRFFAVLTALAGVALFLTVLVLAGTDMNTYGSNFPLFAIFGLFSSMVLMIAGGAWNQAISQSKLTREDLDEPSRYWV